MKHRVFISYRRRDSVAHVHALHGRLAAVLGAENIFMDVDTIALGSDFIASIREAIAGCELMIAVIGPGWVGGDTPGERRIDRADDVVRLEIAEALRSGLKVVPLMLGGAEPPRPDALPQDLAGLDRRQGFAIRDDRFADDMDLFVLRVSNQLGLSPAGPTRGRARAVTPRDSPPGLDRLADAVSRHWIAGVLEPNIGAGGMVDLGYRLRPDLVPNPFAELINPAPCTAAALDAPGFVDDLPALLDGSGRRLLLLGEPGAGKTTSLLALARHLLTRRDMDPAEPVPLVLHLGSWRPERGDLSDWLVAEMNQRYRLPLATGRLLLRDGCLLPLLDGLDELPEPFLAPCVEAIQLWARQETIPGFAVCCRRADYERIRPRLAVGAAAEIAPLDTGRLRALWRARGVTGPALDAMAANPEIARLGQTPLMAKMASATRADPGLPTDPAAITQKSLLDAYIGELFRRAPPLRKAPEPSVVLRRLGWIAERMKQAGQTQLQIESMDSGWLSGPTQRLLFAVGFGILVGLLAGLVMALYWWILTPNIDLRELDCPGGDHIPGTCAAMHRLLPLWPLVGVLWGMVLVGLDPWIPRRRGLAAGTRRQILMTAGVAALYVALWWSLWLVVGALLGTDLVLGPIALSGFALSVLIAGWRSQRPGLTGAAITVESMTWHWSGAARGLVYGIPVGLGLWAINASLLGDWMLDILPAYLLLVIPVAGLLGGLRGRSLPGKIRPNEGIRLSARNALIALVAFGVAGVLGGIGSGTLLADLYRERLALVPGGPLQLNPGFVMRHGLANGMALAIIAGLWFGGAEVIKHLLLRLVAAVRTPLPLKLVGFLDRVCDLGLMQRVGGGYQFAHRLIGEHIAAYRLRGSDAVSATSPPPSTRRARGG